MAARVLLVGGAVVLGVLAGCSSSEPGEAVPAPGPASPQQRGENRQPPSPPPSGHPRSTPAKAVKACELLTADDLGRLALTANPRPGARDDRCGWENTGVPVKSLSIDVLQSGLGSVKADGEDAEPTELTVGTRRALKQVQGAKACSVFVENGSGSIEVGGRVNGSPDDSAQACALAEQAAPLVAAKLG
ncbi:DUF3558 family protein [Amycolatopsis suaedae]|uniref:DUF3558 family protein n=1 Tax=Amycolatopsis suaedae TaxID=2510978 RepID=UPI0013EF1013|nr:DUF3558 family protein [Amycolatopsis suaedae]